MKARVVSALFVLNCFYSISSATKLICGPNKEKKSPSSQPYIGGDDFMFTTRPEDIDQVCKALIKKYNSICK